MKKKKNLFEILGFQDNNGDGKTNLADVFTGKKTDPSTTTDNKESKSKWLKPALAVMGGIGGLFALWKIFKGGGSKKRRNRRR